MTSKYFDLSKFKHTVPDSNDVIYISNSHLHDMKVSRIYANHLQRLTFPGHVKFEDTVTKTLYNKGEMYNVLFIDEDHFIVEGHISSKNNQHLIWQNSTHCSLLI